MAVVDYILIPLSNGVDGSGYEHIESFESVAERIQTVRVLTDYDNFDDGLIDSAKWTEVDTGSYITETGGQMRLNAPAQTLNTEGIISKTIFQKTTNNASQFKVIVGGSPYVYFGVEAATSLSIAAQGFGIYFQNNNQFWAFVNGSQYFTGFLYVYSKTYNIKIVYKNPGWELYVQSPDDSNYSTDTLIYSTITDSAGTLYFQANVAAVSSYYLDDVKEGSYPASVEPVPAWKDVAVGTVIKWSTARVVIYKSGVIQAATSTDFKCQKAVNNGADNGTWLALSHGTPSLGLRGQADDTITNAINSVRIKSQFNSDMTYQVKASMFLRAEVAISAGGGGISKARLINTGGF